jgi:glycosyltransferase involved in cell wall biosynthesis
MSPGLDGDWDGVIVLCSANNWDAVKVADRHMAEHLTEHAPVLFVDPPMSHLTSRHRPELAGALEKPRLRGVGARLARLTPVMPPCGHRPGLAPLSHRMVRRQLRRAMGELGTSARAVVTALPSWPLFEVCGERRRVFWAQDDYAGGASLMGLDSARVLRAELTTAGRADLIVASSPVVHRSWTDRGYDPVLIPFGCDSRLFGSGRTSLRAADVNLAPPIAGYVGQANNRIDLDLLEAVVNAGLSLLMVGPIDPMFEPTRTLALLERPKVQWVGPKAHHALPSYLNAIDVGLVPYTRSAFNLGSFPLKTLEYLSAGLPVVSTDLPATRWLATDLVAIDSSAPGFAEAVRRSARLRRDPDAIRQRREFAASHDWSCRARDLAQLIDVARHATTVA